jgi:hypothetical protein
MMESVTSHLASCETCAAAARELEEESALLTSALTAEFEASVPTERLRQRIDAAVVGERVAFAQPTGRRSGLAAFFSGLLNFGTQRTLGFASLAVVLAFAAIIGAVMMRNKPAEPVTAPTQVATTVPSKANPPQATTTPVDVQNTAPTPIVASMPTTRSGGTVRPNRTSTPSAPKLQPVKLFPGERSYLQTIARLDSTIKSNKKAMRPSLQVEYERNLAVVDRAIAATRSAAKSNPNDPDAADFMFAAYQSKVDLLNTIADARLSGGRGH